MGAVGAGLVMAQPADGLELQLRPLALDAISMLLRGVVGDDLILVGMNHIHRDFPLHVAAGCRSGHRDRAGEEVLVPGADEPGPLAAEAEAGDYDLLWV